MMELKIGHKDKMQQTSLKTFYEIKDTLVGRQREVYNCLREIQPATNLMISKKMGLAINSVTPRIKELREKKLVGVSFEGTSTTGRKAIFWECVR